MSAGRPLICSECWEKETNRREPCPCILECIANVKKSARREGLEEAAKKVDDLRWWQHDLSCDDRLGDGSPGIFAYAAKEILALMDKVQKPTPPDQED